MYRIRLQTTASSEPHYFAFSEGLTDHDWRFTTNLRHASDFHDFNLAVKWFQKATCLLVGRGNENIDMMLEEWNRGHWSEYPIVRITVDNAIKELVDL